MTGPHLHKILDTKDHMWWAHTLSPNVTGCMDSTPNSHPSGSELPSCSAKILLCVAIPYLDLSSYYMWSAMLGVKGNKRIMQDFSSPAEGYDSAREVVWETWLSNLALAHILCKLRKSGSFSRPIYLVSSTWQIFNTLSNQRHAAITQIQSSKWHSVTLTVRGKGDEWEKGI